MTAPPEEDRRESLIRELRKVAAWEKDALEAITRAAADLTGCPIALVGVVAGDREHFLAHHGWDVEGAPRDWSFCTHAIGQLDFFEVRDALADPRVRTSPLVTGEPHIRSYFSKTLTLEGTAIGTLCVIDRQARQLSPQQRSGLEGLAAGVEGVLSAQRQMERVNRATNRLADLAVASEDEFWETDEQHRLSWGSAGLRAMWGVPSAFEIGEPLPNEEVLDERGDPLTLRLTFSQLLDQHATFSRAVLCRSSQRGEIICVSMSAVPRFCEGVFCGYRGTMRNVTGLVVAERRGHEARHALELIAGEAPGLICLFQMHPDGRSAVRYASERIQDIFELTADELRTDASPVFQRIHPDDLEGVIMSLHESASSLTRWRGSYRVLLPKRGLRVLSGQAMPERFPDGSTVWYGVLTDVTEEVREREQVDAMRIERDTASRAAQLRAELMSRVSHELRTPLNAILGFSQMLRLRFPDSSAEPGLSLRYVQHAGQHLLSLINDMLDSAAIEAGRFALTKECVSVRTAIKKSLELVTPQASEKKIRFVESISEEVDAVVGDDRAIRQILLNLVSNAIKFSPANTVISIHASASGGGDVVDVSVCDQGPGIPPPLQERLFEPFERLNADARGVGTGLGLSISRSLARGMGGDIRLVPATRGSCFRLSLPAAEEKCSDVPTTDFAPDLGTSGPADTYLSKILYIEDDPVNAIVMEGFIRQIGGFELSIATTGQEGIELAKLLPDLILLDMHLPDCDGLEVLKMLRERWDTRDIPVIAVSADAMPEQLDGGLAAGFQAYVTKPIQFDELARQIRTHLRKVR